MCVEWLGARLKVVPLVSIALVTSVAASDLAAMMANRLVSMIETERLILRPLTRADVDQIVDLHGDPRVNRFVPSFSYDQALQRISEIERQWSERGHGICAVELEATGTFIGRCGLNYWPEFDEVEVGWILKPEAWGHGYATEAAQSCLEWGFSRLDVRYLTAMIDPGNTASARVAERLGFSPRRVDTLFDKTTTVWALDRPESLPSPQA